MHPHRSVTKPTIAIVGGETLLGNEVRDLFEASDLDASIKLIASDEAEEATILARGRDEPVVINSLLAADIGTARVVILAGSAESGRKAYEKIQKTKPPPQVIDLSGSLEDRPEARLRAPMVEASDHQVSGTIQVIAHPASIALALLLTHLQRAGAIHRSVVQVFEPASERGQAGIDELQKQTAGLLSFKPLAKDVYDAQVSFNMLARYGSESSHSIEDIELKIDRHLASILASTESAPMPSLRLIQAPVFHGYSVSVWAKFESDPGAEAILRALKSDHIDLRTAGLEPPTNVGVAGQRGITVGAIAQDRNEPKAFWFWLVADNLRIAAENAVEVAREFLQ
jgi:aspartate-semialdehyde dehydrogenase